LAAKTDSPLPPLLTGNNVGSFVGRDTFARRCVMNAPPGFFDAKQWPYQITNHSESISKALPVRN
jgi:hypothetical protein